ncbi:ABC transporter permease [Spiroplasma cantharicola]|uniref:Uncharacterized protein n=1 Tax=Spiroplasma cantharicola TaxID=362837 RepID=A0A0M5KCJ4_9MOLU|nr:ABC transporter permease [Spiroplasma cantharicola]ALD66343.1 hypothetical protein SCANT_v1c04370 [Spiroplasma cantharicola]
MTIFNPISSRIMKHTMKSKFFWITFCTLIFTTFIIDILFLIKIKGTQSQPDKVVAYNYIIYATLTFFILLFEIFFANRFWMKDKSNGILNIEYRNDISINKIFWIRFISNKLILLTMLLSFYFINVLFFSFVKNIYFQINLLNQIIVLIGIISVDIFVSSIFIIVSQFKKQVTFGVIAGVFILVLPFNSFINLLTNLSNESYVTAENNIKYETTKRSHELYKSNSNFKLLVDQYSSLPSYLKLNNESQTYIIIDSEEDYAQFLADKGAFYFFSLYKEKFPYNRFYNFNEEEFKNNLIFQFIEQSNKLFELESVKPINNSSESIEEIWADSYYSINSKENIVLDGKYNFNELIKKLKVFYKNDQEKLEIISLVNFYCINVLSVNRDLSFLELGDREFLYGESLVKTVIDTNMNPGVMIFEKGLLDIINAYYNVNKNYSHEINENNNEFAISQTKKLYWKSFINPFFVLNEIQTFNYFNNKYQQNILLSNSSAFPSENYTYYHFVLKDNLQDTNFPNESMVKKIDVKNLSFLIIINFILCYIISFSLLLISFKLFKKYLQI